MEHIVIIGNGISGVTLARHIRKLSNKKITIISNETEYFFSRTALMYVFMGHMKFEHTQPYEPHFWSKNRIDLYKGYVNSIAFDEKKLHLEDGNSISYDKLIIATGSKPNKFGWKNQNAKGVLGMYHKQDLEQLEILAKNCKRAVVVGGGLIGIELVEMLASRNIPTTFLVRESSFWNGVLPAQESEMINKHILEHHIDLRLNTSLDEVLIDEEGAAKAIKTSSGEIIECTIVGLAAGVSPNIHFLENTGLETNKGVLVNRFLETNIPDVYAIGDCAEQREAINERKTIEAVWYTGRMMGEVLAQTICSNKMQYNPSHWFNSAKFLDIEYQTYGWVWAKPKENETHLHWQHASGKKAITIAFDTNSRQFLGINNFGIRLRHEFFDSVLNDRKSVDYVIDNLKKANFDPEFYKHYEKEIALHMQSQMQTIKT